MPVTIINTEKIEERAYRRGYYDALVKYAKPSQIDHMLHLFGDPEREPLRSIVTTLRNMRAELNKEGRGCRLVR